LSSRFSDSPGLSTPATAAPTPSGPQPPEQAADPLPRQEASLYGEEVEGEEEDDLDIRLDAEEPEDDDEVCLPEAHF
jgi:hypothetical protein